MILDDQKAPRLRLGHAAALARTGQPAQAVAVADELARAKKVTGATLYDCSCVFALASAATKEDATLREQYAARAVALLRQAHAAGFFKDAAHVTALKKDVDLAALHARDDYQKLLAELDGK